MVYSWGRGWIKKNVLGSTPVVEQLSFSLFLSILTFNFDLIFGVIFYFLALTGYFLGWGRVQTLFWGLFM